MSAIIQSLPAKPTEALMALSIYRFLTVKQFVKLGIGASEASVRKNILPKLHRCRKPLAKKRKLGRTLPDVHYLTEHGAKYLADLYKLPVEEFPYPKGQVQFGEMFARHRFAQVDFHIGYRQWADSRPDVEILFTDMDFDIIGSRRQGTFISKTEIRVPHSNVPIKPDGMFGIENNGTPLIYALEVHRTTETKRVIAQIKRYIEVLESGAAASKYGLETSPLICSIHMKANVLNGVKTALLKTPSFDPFKGAFLFNTFDNITNNLTQGWVFADDNSANPFGSKAHSKMTTRK